MADLSGCAPSAIPGPPHADNRGALDWSAHGLVAYGCHDVVVVFEPGSCEVVQTLDCAGARVTRVSWAPRETTAGLAKSPRRADLLSGDTRGHVTLWDVLRGSAVCHCVTPSPERAVAGLAWHPAVSGGALVLYAGGTLVLWQLADGEPRTLWSYADVAAPILSIPTFAPADPSTALVVGAGGWLLRLRAEGASSPSAEPRDRLRVVDPAAQPSSVADGSARGSVLACAFLQLLAVDLRARAAVGSAALERRAAPFTHLLSLPAGARAPNLVLCAHADGCLSAYVLEFHQAALDGASVGGLGGLCPDLPRASLRDSRSALRWRLQL
ncbi:hypothetical protein T492DRAFT_864797 [Pavlovales sp. CCMP2436]|nr:hypothetical protein T492DRAFT_864797 [Pavlovales sp. CCMP2436]